MNFTEDFLEEAAIEILQGLGYIHLFAPEISCDGEYPERKDYRDVILENRVKDALFRINRDLPREALEEAYRQIITFNSPSLTKNNRSFHKLLVEGIQVSYKEKGNIRTKRAYIVDFDDKGGIFILYKVWTICQ